MTNQTIEQGMQTIEQGMRSSWNVASKVYRVAKVAVIAAVIIFASIGAYVSLNAELRNQTIDYAQGENQTTALKAE